MFAYAIVYLHYAYFSIVNTMGTIGVKKSYIRVNCAALDTIATKRAVDEHKLSVKRVDIDAKKQRTRHGALWLCPNQLGK